MSFLLWIGTILGAIVGLAHALYLWRVSRHELDGHGAAVYRGVWAVMLWVVFGTYVLVLWIIGAIAQGLTAIRPPRKMP